MKSKILVILISIASSYFLIEKVISDDNLEKNLPTKSENQTANESEVKGITKIGFPPITKSLQDYKDERAKYPSGIKIIALHESDASEETKARLKQHFDNLHKYGNFNQNKLGNEFRAINKFRKNVNKDYPLSFIPTESEFLEKNFKLTGKYASGTFSKASGFNSYTRLFENNETKGKIEITEMYLNPKTHSLIEIFKESFNRKINGLDLTFQEIPVGNTMVYTVDFANNQKMYSLSTIKVEKKDVENLVFSLIEASKDFKSKN